MKCNNCNSFEVSVFIDKSELKIYKCKKCDLVFKNDVIIDYQKLDKDYYLAYNFNRKKEVKELIKIIEKYIHKKRRSILEIGCGSGAILNEFKKNGFHVYGYEPSKIACQIAKDKFGITSIQNDYFEKNNFDEIPDVILLCDVIEHLNSPNRLFQNIKNNLSNSSILIVRSGNPSSFNARLLPAKWLYYHINQHVAFYNKKALKFLANQTGLSILHYYKFRHAYGGFNTAELIKNIIRSGLIRIPCLEKKENKFNIQIANDHFICVLKRHD